MKPQRGRGTVEKAEKKGILRERQLTLGTVRLNSTKYTPRPLWCSVPFQTCTRDSSNKLSTGLWRLLCENSILWLEVFFFFCLISCFGIFPCPVCLNQIRGYLKRPEDSPEPTCLSRTSWSTGSHAPLDCSAEYCEVLLVPRYCRSLK